MDSLAADAPMHTVPIPREVGQLGFSALVESIFRMDETQWQRLADAARAACAHAYCPYSRFPVGAAVLTADGSIASGCNVENASFGLTCCAERNAIFRAISDGATSIVGLVLYTPTPQPVAPCGACRQVLAEFGPGARVVAICHGPQRLQYALPDLLPHGFTLPPTA
jgi:cytidine deaminase